MCICHVVMWLQAMSSGCRLCHVWLQAWIRATSTRRGFGAAPPSLNLAATAPAAIAAPAAASPAAAAAAAAASAISSAIASTATPG